jgi:hypothetical protein
METEKEDSSLYVYRQYEHGFEYLRTWFDICNECKKLISSSIGLDNYCCKSCKRNSKIDEIISVV